MIDARTWKEDWLDSKYICLFPNLDRSFQHLLPDAVSSHDYRNGAYEFISQIKILLLFHDAVDALAWNVFSPVNIRAKNLFHEILVGTDFTRLCHSELIAVETWDNGDFSAAADRSQTHLMLCGWNPALSLAEHAIQFDGGRMTLFNHPGDGSDLAATIVTSTLRLLSNNDLELDSRQKDILISAMQSRTDNDWERITAFLMKVPEFREDAKLLTFAKRVAMSVYEIGDTMPHRLPVPYCGTKQGDSPLRTSLASGSLALLHSPVFLRRFLENFIEPALVQRVATLTVEQLRDLHNRPFWRSYLDDFHAASNRISKLIGGLPAMDVEGLLLEELSRHFTTTGTRKSTVADILIEEICSWLPFGMLSRSPTATRSFNSWKTSFRTFLLHPSFQRFMNALRRELMKSTA